MRTLRLMSRLVPLAAAAALLLPGCANDPVPAEVGVAGSGLTQEQFDALGEAERTVFLASDPDAPPDLRREALLRIATSTAAAEPVYLEFYRATLAAPGVDATVAAVAASALGRHGEPADTGRLTPLLQRDDAFLRWRAAAALQRLHNRQAVPALVRAANDDEDADVRMTAAHALGQYRRRDAFDGLVAALDDRDFGVSRSARDSLILLTGQDAGDDPRAWNDVAGDRGRALFDDAGPYTYTPHPPRRTLLAELLLFWRPPTAEPQTPVGYDPPTAADASP
ncbi:MAG: HEAT repeat domain-containing protein [Planctomycetota bacterium]